jgi:hypothetical protein
VNAPDETPRAAHDLRHGAAMNRFLTVLAKAGWLAPSLETAETDTKESTFAGSHKCRPSYRKRRRTMTESMEILAGLSLLVFVIGSMGSMGLSLKIKQIIAPPNDVKRLQKAE